MKICLLEPFFGGSHKSWAEGLQKHLDAEVHILSLKGKHWKWRMHGGAISLAKQFNALEQSFDLLLATDMLDLNIFLAHTRRKTEGVPVAIYFHENQLSYPWSSTDQDVDKGRNLHYAFINYASALAADQVYFNSEYHRSSFLNELERFLRFYPDERNLDELPKLRERSEVLPIGMELKAFDAIKIKKVKGPRQILWNHRWEYDKNPASFFELLRELQTEGIAFQLAVLGESFAQEPKEFVAAKKQFSNEISHWGYVDSFEEYAQILWSSHLLPVTSIQDFFGISIVEASYCGVTPMLPNRLSYPELCSGKFLYQDLNQTIKQALTDSSLESARSEVNRFDWSVLAPQYLSSFEKLVNRLG